MVKAKTTNAFDTLTPAQRKAATFGTVVEGKGVAAGPLLISAGAGTGKTHTLVHRVAHLTLNGVDPARILLLTFTRRAAQEIIQRAQIIVAETLADRGRLGDRSVVSRLIWSGTFYSVGSRILRLFAKHLKLDPAFTVLDRSEAADLMDAIRDELGLSAKEKRFPRKEACLAIYSSRVNRRVSLKQTLTEQFPSAQECEQDLTRLYREYVARKQKNNLLDADDVLLYWHMMMQNPTLAAGLAKNFDHVLIDDYQDTSTLQVEILQALKPDGAGVTVAGDDAQAIHPFRAAAAENILGFAKRFAPKEDSKAGAKVETIVLAQNYRSTQRILDCANALMADSAAREQRKTLLGTRQATQKPFCVNVDDATTQAEYIVSKILATRDIGGVLKRHAILFRGARHSDALEAELGRRNIPYMKHGDPKFLEAAHVQDLLSVLRWADNPRNSIAGLRVLKLVPDIDAAYVQKALALVEANGFSLKSLAGLDVPRTLEVDWKKFYTLMEKLTDPTTPWAGQVTRVREWYKPQLERLYESSWSRISDLERLEQLLVQYASRERFLTELTLEPPPTTGGLTSQDGKDDDYVILSTIHAAKGQEWDIIYVLDVADGNLPSQPSRPALLEEERRLLYVAVTRARNELHICAPLKLPAAPQAKGSETPAHEARSRFITDRVLECVERTTYRSLRGAENLRAGETVSVDVAAQLKEMW